MARSQTKGSPAPLQSGQSGRGTSTALLQYKYAVCNAYECLLLLALLPGRFQTSSGNKRDTWRA